jgi:hypothetical protein
MKAISKARALSTVSLLATGLLMLAAHAAPAATPAPKVVQKVKQPVGTPHRASSFAPHPTSRRTFGDPIQPPIFGHVEAKNPPPK